MRVCLTSMGLSWIRNVWRCKSSAFDIVVFLITRFLEGRSDRIILLQVTVSSCKSSRAFGSRNKAVMESSRVAENTLWINK
jgi:hypothetical protein